MMVYKQYLEAYRLEAKFNEAKAANYPDRFLVLSDDEIDFVKLMRGNQEDVFSSSLTDEESIAILDKRVKESEAMKQLNKSIEKAIQINTTKECYFLPYFRSCILVRMPTQDEYDNHKVDLAVIDIETNLPTKERIRKEVACKSIFAKKLVVYPALQDLPLEKRDLVDHIYNFSLGLAADLPGLHRVKLCNKCAIEDKCSCVG